MQTVINAKLLEGVEFLRSQGEYRFPCSVLHEGAPVPALLGPRIDSVHVWIKRDGCEKKVACYGEVSLDDATLAMLERAATQAAAAHETRMQAHYAKEVARMQAETAAAKAAGRSPWQDRRDRQGRYAGRYRSVRV